MHRVGIEVARVAPRLWYARLCELRSHTADQFVRCRLLKSRQACP